MHSTRMGTHRTRATFLRLLRLPPPQPQLLLLCSLLPAPIDALIGMHALLECMHYWNACFSALAATCVER